MASDAQIEANRANAQNSTGPRTQQGKAVSSRNALKHGLTSATVLLPDEDPAEYKAFSDALLNDYAPLDALETSLVAELIDLQWRLRRVSRLETRILSADSPDFKALNNIGLHASRTKRQFSATLKEFQEMHQRHQQCIAEQWKEGALLYNADRIMDRPSNLEELGFDITAEQISAFLQRKEAIAEARRIVHHYRNQSQPAA